jgi:hypothetical protein
VTSPLPSAPPLPLRPDPRGLAADTWDPTEEETEMPMSDEAARGVRAAVTWNPDGAEQLLGILRALPVSVRKKPRDRYGPLSVMLMGMLQGGAPLTVRTIGAVRLPVRRPPLAAEELRACEAFNREWLEGRFSKQELADILERELAALMPGGGGASVAPGTTINFRRGKTTLHGPDGERDIDDVLG